MRLQRYGARLNFGGILTDDTVVDGQRATPSNSDGATANSVTVLHRQIIDRQIAPINLENLVVIVSAYRVSVAFHGDWRAYSRQRVRQRHVLSYFNSIVSIAAGQTPTGASLLAAMI